MRKLTKVLRYLRKYWVIAALSPLFMILEVSMDLLLPDLMSRIVDEGVLPGDMEVIFSVGLRMLIVAFIGCFGDFRDDRIAALFMRSAQGRVFPRHEYELSADRRLYHRFSCDPPYQ